MKEPWPGFSDLAISVYKDDRQYPQLDCPGGPHLGMIRCQKYQWQGKSCNKYENHKMKLQELEQMRNLTKVQMLLPLPCKSR